MNITVAIITKNEEANIGRCLASAPFADEVVVVDSGSTDRTVEIAKELGARVVNHAWVGHVKQKQHAVDIATHDWIFSLDADEEVSEPLRRLIRQLKEEGAKHDAYTVRRKTFYLGRWIDHSGWYPDTRIRFFNRQKAHWGGYDPHDEVVCEGRIGVLDGDLNHYSYRDLTHHLQRINEYTGIMARERWDQGKRATMFDIVLRPPFAFCKKYFLQKGFLDGRHGFVVCALAAYYVFCKYAKLWERGLPDAPR